MQPILRLTRWEWFRMHHRAPFLVLAGMALAIPLFSLVVVAMQLAGWLTPLGSSGYFGAAAGSLSFLSPILAIVLSSYTHAGDLQNGTCRTLTARGASRESVIAAKSLAGAALLLGYHLLVLAAAAHFRRRIGASLRWLAGRDGFGISLLDGFPALPGAGNRFVSLAAVGVVYPRCGFVHCFCRGHILSAGQCPGCAGELARSRSNSMDPLGNCPGAAGR